MIQHLLFDLDDTLYPQRAGLMREISEKMSDYMTTRVGIPAADVARVRQAYWEKFGTTLRGLYLVHHIDPQDFLDTVHNVPVEKYLQFDARLDALLAAMPRTKHIFTNAPADYARRVLDALGIARHFQNIFDINFIAYESKPHSGAYTRVLDALGARGDECAMIDDTARNLAAARELGMRTVWLRVDARAEVVSGAEFEIDSIYELEQISF